MQYLQESEGVVKEELCQRSGKRRFESKSDAQQMGYRIKEKLNIYKCNYCGGFHFSKSDRPKRMSPAELRQLGRA